MEGDDVADVLHAGEVHDEAFKSEAKAGVGGRAELSEVEVPPVGFLGETQFINTRFEDIEPIFSLGTTNEFADAGNKDIHCTDGFVVVVAVHVEGFDVLGVVGNDGGAADFLFRDPTFVLGLEIATPFDREFEIFAGVDEHVDGVGVGDALERGFGDVV